MTAREKFEEEARFYKELEKNRDEAIKEGTGFSTWEKEAYEGLDGILRIIYLAEQAIAELDQEWREKHE